MHAGAVSREGTLRDIVDAHPSSITFDAPPVTPPEFSGLHAEVGRVEIRTFALQRDLYELLTWADAADVHLTGLSARAASLESVFLDIAGETPFETTGANR
jgi:ABC-2 type transport system ATP-binding protein